MNGNFEFVDTVYAEEARLTLVRRGNSTASHLGQELDEGMDSAKNDWQQAP